MKSKKIKLIIIPVVILLLTVAIFFMVSGKSAYSSVFGFDTEKTITNSSELLSEKNFDMVKFNEKWSSSSERITYRSKNGNSVYINYICAEKNQYNTDTIILIPPLGYDYTIMLPVAEHFLEKGINTVTFDQRMHGQNNASTFTFGHLESDDLQAVLDYIKMNISTPVCFGLFAQGTGTFTASYYLSSGYNNDFDFVILENPSADACGFVEQKLKGKNGIIPEKLFNSMAVSSINNKFGVDCDKINFLSFAELINIPALVLYQEGCPEYSAESGKEFFEALRIPEKDSAVFSSSGYMTAFYDENEKYTQIIDKFIFG
ncbi:MAG: hypothetical protein E7505_04105 [Ruminococcus sp.]|nr:hypothetical protein [Ruminococcus sp.]